MEIRSMENTYTFSFDNSNEWIEIIPGFIPEKQDKPSKINSSVLAENDSLEDIRKNIVHLEICLTHIKNSVESL